MRAFRAVNSIVPLSGLRLVRSLVLNLVVSGRLRCLVLLDRICSAQVLIFIGNKKLGNS